nr:MAG TPA: tail tape measure [Caudoviricetes sp.]
MPNINTKFTLSGEKEYKQAISEIGSGMKVLDAEMRKVTSAYGKNADSAKLLGQQNDILQRQIYSQTEKIRYMQEALKNSVKKTGESSKATMAWQASLQNATAKLNDLNNQMRENEKRMEGEKEQKYRENIERLSASMDVLDAEMRKVSAKYADNAESAELSAAKTDLLTQKISLQYDKIDNLKAALEEAAENYGSNAVETLRWEKELNNAEAELYKLNGQLKNNTEQIEDTTTATEDAGQSMGNLGDVVNGLTSKLGIQLPDGMKSSMNAMGSLDASSLALAGTFAAVAAAIVKVEKAMISMTKESASFADNIITLSMQTGQSTEQLQEFAYASELIDVSVDTLQGSLTKLTNNMQDTMNGTGNAKASFEALGVSVTNADGSMRSANDVFYETIDALGQVKNETERDAMSMDIFGRSAQDLNPLIIQGSKTLKAYAEEAHNMGYVLDDEALSALGAVDDAYQRLQKTQEGVKNQLAVEFAPYLEEFYGDLTSGIKTIGSTLQQSGLVDAFGMLLETAGDIIAPMDTLSNDKVPALTRALRPLAELMAAIADAGDFVSGLLSLDFNKVGTALGLNYGKGQMSNVQKLNTKWMQQDTNRATAANGYGSYFDTDTGKAYGNMEAYANAQYEALVRAGDSSVLGKSQELWVQEYLKKLRGNAAGTDNWSGGWTKVNENGLERIYLPSGSRIQTASETRYTSGDTYNTTVYVDHVEDLNTILRIAKNARITARMGAK